MKISVCIPCHINDFEDLKFLLSDLKVQTRRPDEILIYIKPVEYNFLEDKDLNLDKDISYNFILDDKYTTMAYAKNKCVEQSCGDIICFMDSDDRVHKSKLEFVENFMTSNKDCDILVHGYSLNDNSILEDEIDISNLDYEKCITDPNSLGIMPPSGKELHHAHSSFRRHVIVENPYPEKDSAYRKDDSILLKYLIKKGYNIFFTSNKLISFNLN